MTKTVFEFYFNPCIYESANDSISLHYTREGAEKALINHKKKHKEYFKKVDFNIPGYMDWGISERTIEE